MIGIFAVPQVLEDLVTKSFQGAEAFKPKRVIPDTILGKAKYYTKAAIRARIGWLGHDPGIYPELSAAENLRFFARVYGLDAIERHNRRKGDLLYGMIDQNPDFYRAPVEKESRSLMNVSTPRGRART